MKYRFPSVALQVMNELAIRRGDCASALLSTARELGIEPREELLHSASFSCGAESALASILGENGLEAVMTEVDKMVEDGKLQPCPVSPHRDVSSCFQKCPLVMDLFLQADRK